MRSIRILIIDNGSCNESDQLFPALPKNPGMAVFWTRSVVLASVPDTRISKKIYATPSQAHIGTHW